jgi:ATP-dependent DNA helicase RecQ
MAVGTALKILEREGYISRPNEKTANAFLKTKVDFATTLGSLGGRAKTKIDILNKLYDRFGEELENGWNFNLEEAAGVLKIKKDSLVRLIRFLVEKDIVEYQPPFRGTEINILKRVDVSEINIDFKVLKEKLERAYAKLDRMEDYIFHFGCRQEYILDYFGDANTKSCKKCDNCLTGSRATERRPSASSGWRKKEVDAKSPLSTKLTQLETFDLYNKGLAPEKIAAERNITIGTVFNHLTFLVEKKLIKDIDKLVLQKKQREIKEAIAKVGGEKLKPIKEILSEEISYEEIKLVIAKINQK